MAADFTQPIQDTPQDTPQDSTSAALDAQVDVLDPNDPQLTSEALDVNTEGDAYAFPPPPPDGKYRAKLKLLQSDDGHGGKVDSYAKRSKKTNALYLCTGVVANIIDHATGKFDGVPVYDRWVSTFVGKDGSSKISTILSHIKKPDGTPWVAKGARLTHKEWMETFIKAMASEPEIGIETIWEWSCSECGKEAKAKGQDYPNSIKGMQKFPLDAASKQGHPVYQPEMKCQKDPAHGYTRTQVSMARILDESAVRTK